MSPVLTAARCTVAPEDQATYIEVVRALAERCRTRGQQIWLFQHTKDARRFIEFTEAPTEMSHRALASRTAEELRLERKLREVASYAPDSLELYREVVVTAKT